MNKKTTNNGNGHVGFYIKCKCKFKGEGCFCSSSVNLANMVAGAFANGLYVEEFPPDQFKEYLDLSDEQWQCKLYVSGL